jgi:hypothetical protein
MTLSMKRGANLKRIATALAAALAAGCGSSTQPKTVVPNPNLPVGLPTPAAAGPVNTYDGGQSPGAWTFTLDNTKGAFSYQPTTFPAAAASGTLQSSGGFSVLSDGSLAYEVLGRAAVLRPGGNPGTRVFAVPQTSCYAITGKQRFQYIALFPGALTNGPDLSSSGPFLGYGSVVASTDSTGKAWQFDNLLGGAWNSLGTTVSGPALFAGTCAAANGQASISFPSTTLMDEFWAPDSKITSPAPSTTQSSIWIGPSGFFAADQSDPASQGSPTGLAGASIAGMAEPSSTLSTSAMAAGQYLGFVYEAPNPNGYANNTTGVLQGSNPPAFTAPVGFGQVVAGSGTTLTGGIFPNDAVTGTPNADTQITLGTEDATYNGLYTSVKVTVLDPAQNCANFSGSQFTIPVTSSINAQGYITCTFPGVAVAGNPDGKYAIFVSTYNWAVTFGGQPMEFFLFQQ